MNEGHTRIREFRWTDIDGVLAVEARAFPKSRYPMEAFFNFAERYPDTFIVIETEADIAGYMIFDTEGHVHSTVVRPEYRRRGFGRMLFDYASAYARKALWLEVRSKNRGAIAFYRIMGMEATERVPNYYGDDDALVMVST
jgi:ribosomal-protein-alanine N-acetyltransferase